MKQEIKAAIFDIDGTVYDYKTHRVLPSTVRVIEQLRQQGIRVIIASGRSSALLGQQILNSIHPDYYVLANGHELLDSGIQPLRLVRFTLEQTQRIADRAGALGIHMMLKFHRFNCIYSGWQEMVSVFGETGLAESDFKYCPQADYHRQDQPLSVTLKGPCDLRDKLADLGEDLQVQYFHDPAECDVFHSSVNKMTGLRQVLQREGIDVEDCVAFGDGENDQEMLGQVGWGVAMGNACPQAKAAARYICGNSWEDGIANFLHQTVLA